MRIRYLPGRAEPGRIRPLRSPQGVDVTAVPALQELAWLVAGEPNAALRLLTLACEQLAMDLAVVSVLDGQGSLAVRQSAHADGTAGPADYTEPLAATWCELVMADGPLLVGDAHGDVSAQALPSTKALTIVSYAGVPLRGGGRLVPQGP